MTSGGRFLVLALLASALACEPAEAPAPAKEPGEPPPDLTEVQLECRSDNTLDIGHLNTQFGPTCDRTTMPLSLETFDLGTEKGFLQAYHEAMALTFMCICNHVTCAEKESNFAVDNARKVFVDDKGKLEREGALSVTNYVASHSCLDATVGVMLYRSGFSCGYRRGAHSVAIRQRVEERYRAEVTGDDAQIAPEADACLDVKPPPFAPTPPPAP